jgi:hypothetical protein
MVSYRGAPHFHPIKSEKSGKLNKRIKRGPSCPAPGIAGPHVFPCPKQRRAEGALLRFLQHYLRPQFKW